MQNLDILVLEIQAFTRIISKSKVVTSAICLHLVVGSFLA